MAGCELFTTRPAEIPTGSNGEGWVFPSSPEIALTNITSSVGRRSSSDYLHSLANPSVGLPTFRFRSDPQTANANPGVFDGWNYDRETQFTQALFSPGNLPNDSISVFDLTIQHQSRVNDTSDVICGYSAHLGHKLDRLPRLMTGQAGFRILRATDGGWYITEWSDVRTSDQPCWSDLKAGL